jgi:hypothetical protein
MIQVPVDRIEASLVSSIKLAHHSVKMSIVPRFYQFDFSLILTYLITSDGQEKFKAPYGLYLMILY